MIASDTTATTGTAISVADRPRFSATGSPRTGGSDAGGEHNIVGVVVGSMGGGGEGVGEGRGVEGGMGASVMTGLSGEGSARNKYSR